MIMISLLLLKICIWRTDVGSFDLSPKHFSVHPSTLLLKQHYTAGCLHSLPDLVAKLPHYLVKPGLPLYRSAYLQTRPSTLYVTLLPTSPCKDNTTTPLKSSHKSIPPHTPTSLLSDPSFPCSPSLDPQASQVDPPSPAAEEKPPLKSEQEGKRSLDVSPPPPADLRPSLALLTLCICNFTFPLWVNILCSS